MLHARFPSQFRTNNNRSVRGYRPEIFSTKKEIEIARLELFGLEDMTVLPVSFNLTLSNVTLTSSGAVAYVLTVNPVAYTLTLSSVGLFRGRKITVNPSAYALALTTVGLKFNRNLTVNPVDYVLTLNDVSLIIPVNYVMTVLPVDYTITLTDVGLDHRRRSPPNLAFGYLQDRHYIRLPYKGDTFKLEHFVQDVPVYVAILTTADDVVVTRMTVEGRRIKANVYSENSDDQYAMIVAQFIDDAVQKIHIKISPQERDARQRFATLDAEDYQAFLTEDNQVLCFEDETELG